MLNRLELTQIALRHMKAAMNVASDAKDAEEEATKLYDILVDLIEDLDRQMTHNETK